MKPSEKEGDGMAMTEQRYGYCDEIAAIVDMSKLTIEGGEEMTTDDVVERLNQLDAKNAALKRENKRLSKIERVARYYLENGEPELADELESLLKERTMTDKERGLYRKYRVSRLDDVEGKHNECFYFVLDTVHDPFATPALRAYANACREEFPVLAQDIDALLTAEEQASVLRRPYTQLAGTRKPMIGGTEITAEEQEDA